MVQRSEATLMMLMWTAFELKWSEVDFSTRAEANLIWNFSLVSADCFYTCVDMLI